MKNPEIKAMIDANSSIIFNRIIGLKQQARELQKSSESTMEERQPLLIAIKQLQCCYRNLCKATGKVKE